MKKLCTSTRKKLNEITLWKNCGNQNEWKLKKKWKKFSAFIGLCRIFLSHFFFFNVSVPVFIYIFSVFNFILFIFLSLFTQILCVFTLYWHITYTFRMSIIFLWVARYYFVSPFGDRLLCLFYVKASIACLTFCIPEFYWENRHLKK